MLTDVPATGADPVSGNPIGGATIGSIAMRSRLPAVRLCVNTYRDAPAGRRSELDGGRLAAIGAPGDRAGSRGTGPPFDSPKLHKRFVRGLVTGTVGLSCQDQDVNPHGPQGEAMPVFAVTTVKGPNWVSGYGIRAQAGWDEHARFFDALVEQGVVILGGPIASTDEADIALLAVTAADERELRTIFADDPWASSGVLRIKKVREWTLWLDSRQGACVAP